jgi:hypothetical protein
MNENCSYNSKAHKNKDTGVLMHSFACKYYFFIAILKGEPRRFEPRPHLNTSRQTKLKVFYYRLQVMHPQWCSGYSAGKLYRKPKFKSLRSYIFSLKIVNKLKKEGRFLNRKVLKTRNH